MIQENFHIQLVELYQLIMKVNRQSLIELGDVEMIENKFNEVADTFSVILLTGDAHTSTTRVFRLVEQAVSELRKH